MGREGKGKEEKDGDDVKMEEEEHVPNFDEALDADGNSVELPSESIMATIEIYQNQDLHVKLRVAAGKTIANTEHPRALHAISEMVANTTALDYTLLNESISMLGSFNENPKAADALLRSMHQLDEKTNQIHITLVKSLNRVRTKDQIFALLDLYEFAKSNMARTEKLLLREV